MLKRIDIENYILIDKLSIDIQSGLNIVTGETGAGKSILLGAVALLLGGRGDASLIKRGAKQMVIEAEFDATSLRNYLEPIFLQNDIDFDNSLVIRRIITESGKSKSYLNEEPVSLAFLKEIGAFLVDIHSQHQTLLLSSRAFQTEIVDSIANQRDLVDKYIVEYKAVALLSRKIEQLRDEAQRLLRDREYFQFQFEQLELASLKEDEQEQLESEREMLANASTIAENLYGVTSIIGGGESNVVSMLQYANSLINKIKSYIPTGDELHERVASTIIELKDIFGEAEDIASETEENPTRLSEVEERLDLLFSLQQKHCKESVKELIEFKNELEHKITSIEKVDDDIIEFENSLKDALDGAWKLALQIRAGREKVTEVLRKQIITNLSMLGMPNAVIEIKVDKLTELTEYGADNVTFLFSANGGALEKIDKVASGGEMSRLMLTLKAIVAHHRTMPTIIFDEIDTGVSGRVADSMGSIMESLARDIQIINITHLPQVASKGQHHFYVYKEHKAGESVSHIVRLSDEQRIEQIAVMLSGSSVTPAALEQAKALLTKK